MNRNGLANTVALVRATHFGANPETASSNAFQIAASEPDAAVRALEEQSQLVTVLQKTGVSVLLLEPEVPSPDAVFPNNWFSTHADGTLVLYSMQAVSRRRERLADLDKQLEAAGFQVNVVVDFSRHERDGRFLEGTGSLVLDRIKRVAYACASPRTDRGLAQAWADRFDYQLCWFNARDPQGRAVYHTNVIMSLGDGIAVICLDAIDNPAEREALCRELEIGDRKILALDWSQVTAFAGNQLFLQGRDGSVVVMSDAADRALRPEQKAILDRHALRVTADIATIEKHGGGGVRCMMAEIFLPKEKR